MLVREMDMFSENDVADFRKIFKLSQEVGDPDGVLTILHVPNYALLCYDDKGNIAGCITYCMVPRTKVLHIGYIIIPVRHRQYDEIFNAMFDAVYPIAKDRALLMELDDADKQNIKLASARSFRKVPASFDALSLPGVPTLTRVSMYIRSNTPIKDWQSVLVNMFEYSYCIRDAENDPRVKAMVQRFVPLNGKV